ncbi:GTPase [Providencia stuartii]|uniref:GTPase n=1 Tax=Providencia stuartii TaxID=588 RepID=UPI003D7F89AB
MSIESEDKKFNAEFDRAYSEKNPDYKAHVNIALVGKVSTGKSSLLNAIFECKRENPIAPVGAKSGVTTEVTPYKLDDNVLIVDCPGLDDIRKENSAVTKGFIDNIDLGLFVVTGSADASQKSNFDDLKNNTEHVLVVLNHIDAWDDLDESAYEEVEQQWKSVLGVDKVFGCCTKGYDPKMKKSAPMDIRGVDELRDQIFKFLNEKGKDILIARHLRDKSSYAIGIISGALVAVAAEAFIPGSAAYITATQVVAITSLNYLYTGEALNKTSVLSLLPTFAGESVGTTLFLWAKSFLPPTGVVDIAAAGIAVVVTFAMLAAVKWVLENNHSLDDKAALKETFNRFKKIGEALKDISLEDIKSKQKLTSLLGRLLSQ